MDSDTDFVELLLSVGVLVRDFVAEGLFELLLDNDVDLEPVLEREVDLDVDADFVVLTLCVRVHVSVNVDWSAGAAAC